MNELKDKDLREALRRREAQRTKPEVPADFMDNVMKEIGVGSQESGDRKDHPVIWRWVAAAVAVAASIALLIVFHFGKEQTPQEPVVAQQTYHGDGSSDTPSANEEPASTDAPIMTDAPVYQKNRPRDTKVVMQLVELIPTSEAKSTNMKTLPESLIAKVKAYDQASDPSRMTGIDDGTDDIMTTMGIDEDPLVAMTARVEEIRQRGQRLEREIDDRMDN